MVNKPKQKGTNAETKVVRYLTEQGLRAHRVTLKGSKDEGDIHLIGKHGCVSSALEVKAGKQTLKINRKQKEDWLKETAVEGQNSGCNRAFLVIAKHGSSIQNYEVWSSDGRQFWYLDEFAKYADGGYR